MTGHYPWEMKQAVYAGLLRGRSATALAREHGITHHVVTNWGRLAGMNFMLGHHGGTPTVDALRAAPGSRTRTYRRLTLADRSFIQAARTLPVPWSYRKIARELEVAPSTVVREVRHHLVRDGRRGMKYSADAAHFHALTRRPRHRSRKLDHPTLRAEVVAGLNEKHSPQQLAGRLRLAYPGRPEMHVSHETIYQALYVQGKGALRHELSVEQALRSGRTGRKPRSRLPPRSGKPWLDGARLSDRPAEVTDRAVPGHWEGDLVVGPNNSGIVTLVERQTRFVLIGKLPGRRDSQTVIDVLADMIQDLPTQLRKTITWDQGSEMAKHAEFTVDSGCRVFFCDPHSPWQRGQNENTNGLIRDYYPKGTDFNAISGEELTRTQDQLNTRPRATLGFWTPREKLNELLNSVALTT